jgi:predicted RNase H-like HicB family nuclease
MKTAKDYMQLPYTTVLKRDEEGDIVARIQELPGCTAHGKTAAAALQNLQEAKKLWIVDCLETSGQVPEPEVEEALPSGKWVQRVPRSLHKKLVSAAKHEGVSLNQFVTSVLAEAAGTRRQETRRDSTLEIVREAVREELTAYGSARRPRRRSLPRGR